MLMLQTRSAPAVFDVEEYKFLALKLELCEKVSFKRAILYNDEPTSNYKRDLTFQNDILYQNAEKRTAFKHSGLFLYMGSPREDSFCVV